MSFPFSQTAIVSSLVFTLLFSFPPTTLSQAPPLTPPDPQATMAACAPRLLQLSTCAAFMQGAAREPLRSCCDNLGQLNSDQPDCICLLFANSSSVPVNTALAMSRAFMQGAAREPLRSCCDNLGQLNSDQPDCICLLFANSSSVPVNTALAMRLPALCNVRVNSSVCSGFPGMEDDGTPDPSSRRRRPPRRRRPNEPSIPDIPSPGDAPPKDRMSPPPSGQRRPRSSGVKLKEEGGLALLMALAAITFTKLMCLVSH